ncbi:MAG: ThiF family adenylyltransferase, partial [Myxococcota bacterium]|nr:ThiF family adenylyltransferase [Myxococcota bacterium]
VYLALAGIGTLGLADFDTVDLSNLQRQILHHNDDVGRPKVASAKDSILAYNPDVNVQTHEAQITSENAMEIIGQYDIVVNGADNFPARYLVNDACYLLGKPLVDGSILIFDGQATVFDARHGPCYRCLYPEPPPPGAVPSCAEGGVLGVLPGLVALIQATEALKLLAGIGEPLYGRLLRYDALRMDFAEFRLKKDTHCPVCGVQPSITELIDYEGFCGVSAAGGEAMQEVSAADVQAARERGDEFLLLDVREPSEWETARIEGAQLLPLGQLEARISELDDWRARRVVVHCHHGGRSANACGVLEAAGFRDVANLAGGIEAWSLTVDPAVPRY